MPCSGCAKRREWLLRVMRQARERGRAVIERHAGKTNTKLRKDGGSHDGTDEHSRGSGLSERDID